MMNKTLAAALVVVGLGAATATGAQAKSPVVPPAKAPTDIVGLAQGNGGFTTLLAAVGCADPAIAGALTSGDQYTVFAPTDAAFQATLGVNASTVCTIPQPTLDAVLLYHVTEGRRFSNSVVPKVDGKVRKIETLLPGASVSVDANGGIVDADKDTSPSIVLADLAATNGVVHVIDEVLLPVEL